MTAGHSYVYFRISKSNLDTRTTEKYRDLRLKALKVSAASFSSTYEIESRLTDADWTSRLLEEDKETFICASVASGLDGSEKGRPEEWVGQLTIRGPFKRSAYLLPEESHQTLPRADHEEERWQMLSVFTLPERRGQGLAFNLCREAITHLQTYRSEPPNVLIRLMVRPDNSASIHLYRKLGFEMDGKCTLAEALVANGDENLLPEDISGEHYNDRYGLIMTHRFSRV